MWQARLVISGLLALACLGGWLTTAQAIITDPVSWWKLTETSGTTANDSGSANLDGTLNGFSVPADWLGTDQGLNFDGVDAQVTCAESALHEPSTDMAISLWVWLDQTAGTKGEDLMLIWKSHSAAPWFSFYLAIGTAENNLLVQWNNTVGTSFNTNGTVPFTALNTWYHIVFTKAGATALIYINNVLATDQGTGHTGTIFNSDGGLALGAESSAGKRLDGRLKQVRFFNHSLSAADVAALFTFTETVSFVRRRPLIY